MSYTIEQGKEAGLVQINVIPKSLVLCDLVAIDGFTIHLCTTPANGGTTLTYNGNTYQARLIDNPIDTIQAQSPQGYDIPGSISLKIADGDFAIWGDLDTHGLRGGTLTVTFVLWDIPSSTFSTNAYVWTFILDKPNIDASGVLTVSGQARESMTRLNVPNFARQNRCGQTFPPAGPSGDPGMYRRDALNNPTSPYYGCGYSPDQTGGVGNITTPNLVNPDGSQLTDSSGCYVMCDLTRSSGAQKTNLNQGCMARLGNYAGTTFIGSGGVKVAADGDIIDDTSGRRTGHFTGDTWISPVGWAGHQYVNPSSGKIYGFNTPNPATGSTYYPIGYGTQWVNATVLAPAGEPNTDRVEAIVCMAPIGPANILKVLVGGTEVTLDNSDQLFTYRALSLGGRSSTVNVDDIYNGQGDPHGSTCWIEIVVPVELSQAGSIPQVQVLVQFPSCLHAYPVATATISGSNTILTFESDIENLFYDGVVVGQNFYLQGGSGVPNGGYTASAVTAGPPGTITIPGTWTGTGGAVFYFPTRQADDAMIDATGTAAANPVWALMDLLAMWGPFTVADFDAQTWWDAAQICAQQISYTDINGNTSTHARYRCSFALTNDNRQSLAKAVLGIRNCAGIILARNPANGLLQCFIEETLADQQPLPIPGSNYNIPVPSITAAGNATLGSSIISTDTTIPLSYAMQLVTNQIIQIGSEMMQVTAGAGTNSLTVTRAYNGTTAVSHTSGVAVAPCGYLAYLFDGAGSIEKGTFKVTGRSLNDTPNTVAFPFQDSANVWVQDSITTIDQEGYVTSGNQEIEAAFQALGIENFDQGTRRSNVALAQSLSGNSRFDAGGTDFYQFRSTVKAAHLASRVGFICGINYEQFSL